MFGVHQQCFKWMYWNILRYIYIFILRPIYTHKSLAWQKVFDCAITLFSLLSFSPALLSLILHLWNMNWPYKWSIALTPWINRIQCLASLTLISNGISLETLESPVRLTSGFGNICCLLMLMLSHRIAAECHTFHRQMYWPVIIFQWRC